MRLVGQMHEISVPAAGRRARRRASLAAIDEAFTRVYTARYTTPHPGRASRPSISASAASARRRTLSLKRRSRRRRSRRQAQGHPAWPGSARRGFDETPVYDRYALAPGDRFAGPAIIEEREATTVVPPGDNVAIDESLEHPHRDRRRRCRPPRSSTPDMPLADAIERIEADPIALEIMWSRLVTVVEEMWLTVMPHGVLARSSPKRRTSPANCSTPRARRWRIRPRAMPVFNLTLPLAVKALLERYPAETLKPGDVLITNDPWLCAGHLFDIAVVTPCFRDGRLVGLMGTVGHVSDIGGTKDSLRAREIYEEGFQIPPMKLYEAGVPNESLLRLLNENVRNRRAGAGRPAFLRGGQCAGGRAAAVLHVGLRHARSRALAAVVQGRSEKAMRDAIARPARRRLHVRDLEQPARRRRCAIP